MERIDDERREATTKPFSSLLNLIVKRFNGSDKFEKTGVTTRHGPNFVWIKRKSLGTTTAVEALESFLRNEAFSALLPMQDLVRISKIILSVFQRLSS